MLIATKEGGIAFLSSGLISSLISFYFHSNNLFYRKRFPISGKIGIPIMISLFFGSIFFELSMIDAHRNPENWKDEKDGLLVKKQQNKSIPIYQYLMNRVHDRPLYFSTVLSLPLIGRIAYIKIQEPYLTIPQILNQTRLVSFILSPSSCSISCSISDFY